MSDGVAARILGQDQDLGFAFEGAGGPFEVLGFGGMEAVNAPFALHIDLISEDDAIDIRAMLDTPGLLTMAHKYDELRYFHGIVSEVERGDSGHRRTQYSVVLRPTFSRLDHISDARIWQEKTVPDIVKQVLGEYGVVDTDWRLELTHFPREYCVQFHETARGFVERLLAEEGIFYFFEHSPGGHRMIFTDAPLATPVLPNAAQLPYNAQSGGHTRMPLVSHFAQRERVRASKYEMRDYTFKNPPYHQKHVHIHPENNGLKGEYPLYDYPGRYKEPGAGDPFTKHRIESVRVDATTGQGQTNCVHLQPGFRFTLTDHDDAKANIQHFLLSVSHSGSQPSATMEDAGDAPTTYSASFTTMPGRLPYRPPLMRKPVVDGPHIAHVTGPDGEEIYCDEHGRIKIWFPWDRHGQKNETSSCWVRVSQNWAGGQWGHMAIPRIGQEVVVEFLDGDPDQPIIMGRTYHSINQPPYPLPDHKTKMVIRSDTHKGKGFNEISFEDENGRENIALHAQKDQTLKVLHNRMKRVDNDQIESVGSNKSIDVASNHQEKIGGSMNLTIGGGGGALGLIGALGGVLSGGAKEMASGAAEIGNPALTALVGGLVSTSLGGEAVSSPGISGFVASGKNRGIAGADQSAAGTQLGQLVGQIMPVSGIMNTIVEKAVSDTIGLARTEQVGLLKNTVVGQVQTTSVGKKQVTKVGEAQSTTVGKTKKTVVGEEYVIEVGKSKLIMKSDGTVILKGVRFNFEASGPVQVVGKVIDLN